MIAIIICINIHSSLLITELIESWIQLLSKRLMYFFLFLILLKVQTFARFSRYIFSGILLKIAYAKHIDG